jgi:hypothetical protein
MNVKKFVLLIVSFLLILPAFSDETKILPSETGLVQTVIYTDSDNDYVQTKQDVQIKLLSGEFKGETINAYRKQDKDEQIQYKLPFGGGAGAGVSLWVSCVSLASHRYGTSGMIVGWRLDFCRQCIAQIASTQCLTRFCMFALRVARLYHETLDDTVKE